MSSTPKTILPGQTIGILGGGQLGRMMVLEGRKMGYSFITLDPTPNSPCGQVSDAQIIAAYDDLAAAEELAARSSVITYEFENVDSAVTARLQARSYVPQGSELLRITQHRVREKTTIAEAGVPVTPFRPIRSVEDFLQAVRDFGVPCVLKTSQGGYDGKGQWRIDSEEALVEARELLTEALSGSDGDPRFVLEQFVTFEKELSVVIARNPSGETKVYPIAENIHRDHILHMSIVPARVPSEIQVKAREIGEKIAEALNLVGVLAIELFLTNDHSLYVNELAPRPHNSGHFTYDACETSQFEQHIRAICNLPLGDVTLWSPVVMVNVLGEHVPAVLDHMASLPANVKVHLYGKDEAKPKRKMGHINVLHDSVDEAMRQIQELGIWP